MNKQTQRLINRLDTAWTALSDSYAGLSDAQLVQPGVVDNWSVKDILAHVTTWEQEALEHLPHIIAGGTPPRYAAQGGIDAFNARATEDGRRMSLAEVLRRRDQTHARLLDFIRSQPEGTFEGQTRARRRLRLDTYGHYPEHTATIQAWRNAALPDTQARLSQGHGRSVAEQAHRPTRWIPNRAWSDPAAGGDGGQAAVPGGWGRADADRRREAAAVGQCHRPECPGPGGRPGTPRSGSVCGGVRPAGPGGDPRHPPRARLGRASPGDAGGKGSVRP